MRGTMLDMYRRPDKLLELCEFLLDKTLEKPMPPPNEYGNLRIFMTITRGSDDFISMKQFQTFYWPAFKKLVMTLIERGATPCIFLEGTFTSRSDDRRPVASWTGRRPLACRLPALSRHIRRRGIILRRRNACVKIHSADQCSSCGRVPDNPSIFRFYRRTGW